MGALLKGIQSVLIALGIIAVIGTGVIVYYNTVTLKRMRKRLPLKPSPARIRRLRPRQKVQKTPSLKRKQKVRISQNPPTFRFRGTELRPLFSLRKTVTNTPIQAQCCVPPPVRNRVRQDIGMLLR